MQKTLIWAAAAMFVVSALPLSFAETKTADYDVVSGPSGNVSLAIAWSFCGPGDEGVFNDYGDELYFGPAGFDKDNNPDDNTFRTMCPPFRSTWNENGFRIGIFSDAIQADSDSYTNFLVTATDTLPASPYFLFCILTQFQDGRGGSDNACGGGSSDDIPDPVTAGCGSISLSSPLLSGGPVNRPVAFLYATFVDENSGVVCLGSSGSLTVSMS